MIKNKLMFVLDRSTSMQRWATCVMNMYNLLLSDQKEKARDTGQSTDAGLVLFPDRINRGPTKPRWSVKMVETSIRPISVLLPLHFYDAHGDTPLRDGVGVAIEHLKDSVTARELIEDDVAFWVNVITDGEENNSTTWTARGIREQIERLRATGRWTFSFNVPPGHRVMTADIFGVPRENVREWETTEQGFRETTTANLGATQSYFQARSAGKAQVESIYKVETDLSEINKKDLKNLVDLSGQMKLIQVPKEEPIKEFVERVTGKPYVIGGTYYQLTKREKVQGSKAVLIKEKSGKRVFGGPQARELIGLPHDGVSLAIVTPGNHATFDIFVQSKTVNRKLVRGTKVILDTHKQTSDQPTWDHTQGAQS